MIPVILAVHVDHGKWVDVPITPDTRCRDVVDCCREPSDEACALVLLQAGRAEQIVPADACMMDILSRWGNNWPAVTFHLQYSEPVIGGRYMGTHQFPQAPVKEYRNWKKLPESNSSGGAELTLSDLRQMAARQQHQIEAHQQLLVAKEQRLKFLKQQEARHQPPQQPPDGGDRLRHLRDRVELQEMKLRRLRALRGQVEQHKANNSNLGAELESIRALFNEKEKELSMAVAKVEELTRQLEDVRRGDVKQGGLVPSPAALEFQKLKRELMYRSKLNEQQNARIAQQRETLARRQSEISQMDQRIAELQQRLQRKRLLNQQLSSQLHAASSRTRPRPPNIAAVEPLKRAEVEIKHEFTPNKKDPKYQTLPYNTKFPLGGNVDKVVPEEKQNGGPPPYPEPPSMVSPPVKAVPPPPRTSVEALSPRSFIGNNTNGGPPPSNRGPPQQRVTAATTNGVIVPGSTNAILTPPKPTSIGPPSRSKTAPTVLPPTVMTGGQPRPVPQTPARLHPAAPSYSYARSRSNNAGNNEIQKPVVPPKPGKPVLPPRQIHGGMLHSHPKPDTVDQALSVLKGDTRGVENQRHINHVPPTNSLHHRLNPSVYNHPPPPKPETSPPIPYTNGDSTQQPQQQGSPLQQSRLNGNGSSPDSGGNIHISLSRRIGMPPAFYFPENQTPPSDLNGTEVKRKTFGHDGMQVLNLEIPSSESEMNSPKGSSMIDKTKDLDPKHAPLDSPPSQHSSSSIQTSSLSPDSTDRSISEDASSDHLSSSERTTGRRKKGNLKTTTVGVRQSSRRVSFDPLALLLDAALEGELELVKKTAKEVPNPSAANDEGITALHNAICAGHLEIVKFLVEFGCDVNAQDSDGWTPLHCAASCNNVSMVKYLVERGACIFATTLSDHETAAEKCEEDEEGFDGCSEYLYSMQEKLGILHGGVVHGVYEYGAQNADELSFRDGDALLVLRKGDDLEREWWWCKRHDTEGYVPRNLLGLHPRVTPKRDQ